MRRFCLIVNPNAGGGRTAKALPEVERTLDQHGLEYRVELTLSLEHAMELAREARLLPLTTRMPAAPTCSAIASDPIT